MKTPYCIGEHTARAVVLLVKTRTVGTRRITYRLLQCGSTLYVSAAEELEAPVTVLLGEELATAHSTFALLVRHGVSPCHLRDVVQDLS